MNFFILPELVSVDIISKWLITKELGKLDTSLCNLKFRTIFCELIQSQSLNVIQSKSKGFMVWVAERRIKLQSLSFFDTDKINWSDIDTSSISHIEFTVKDHNLFRKCPASVHIIINTCANLKSLKITSKSSFSKEFLDGIHTDIFIALSELYLDTDSANNLKMLTKFSNSCTNLIKITIRMKGLDLQGKDLLTLLQRNKHLQELYVTVDISKRFKLGPFFGVVKAVTTDNLKHFVVDDDTGTKLCMLI